MFDLHTAGRTRKKGWRRRGREERKSEQRYSKFEVISDREVSGRQRLDRSPDLRDLTRPREAAVRLKFKKTAGSQTGTSKVCGTISCFRIPLVNFKDKT